MKRTNRLHLPALCSAALLLGTGASLHAIDLNDKFSVDGYLGTSYRYNEADGSSDSMNIDAAKLLFTAKQDAATGAFSLFYNPNGPEDVTLLDAYFSYNLGKGTTVSAGKFLSWHGYESFDLVYMNSLTYASGDFLGGIPGYHSGVRLEQAGTGWTAGVAVLDSVYTPSNRYLEGDGELKDNAGFEAYYKYTGTDRLTLFFGAAYDTSGSFQPDSVLMFNFWGDYALSEMFSVAGELIVKDSGDAGKGWSWTGYATMKSSDTFSTYFRLSGEYIDNGPEFLRASVAPTVALTPSLSVRAELTYTDYSKYTTSNAVFAGVQGVFKF